MSFPPAPESTFLDDLRDTFAKLGFAKPEPVKDEQTVLGAQGDSPHGKRADRSVPQPPASKFLADLRTTLSGLAIASTKGPRPQRPRGGFTLIDLAMALSIFGLLATIGVTAIDTQRAGADSEKLSQSVVENLKQRYEFSTISKAEAKSEDGITRQYVVVDGVNTECVILDEDSDDPMFQCFGEWMPTKAPAPAVGMATGN